jgi:1,4-dihydroxy-2-naphthoyl-CoA hydrolase
MNFSYSRTIHFADTDGAGVVYFAQIFSICHEAYEASLAAQGINLRDFFCGSAIAIPIVHAEADFRQPMFCGDRIIVTLQPQKLSPDSYEIKYEIHQHEIPQENSNSQPKSQPKPQLIAQAQTKHICINPHLRTRQELPVYLHQWLHSKYP